MKRVRGKGHLSQRQVSYAEAALDRAEGWPTASQHGFLGPKGQTATIPPFLATSWDPNQRRRGGEMELLLPLPMPSVMHRPLWSDSFSGLAHSLGSGFNPGFLHSVCPALKQPPPDRRAQANGD